MKNVFIAVGGSGTKVAEALVRLLAVGCPTRRNGRLTSAGDSLMIWRVDPDSSSGAAEDLKSALDDYRILQGCLSDGNQNRENATSRWAMDILTNVVHLDPLELPKKEPTDNKTKTLEGILNSRYGKVKSSTDFLMPFYEEKELNVPVDKGFYQKPFIGAAVMAAFSQSLQDENSPAGGKASLTAFENTPTNFFLCGSLHGGTGACGVPVMARFLSKKQKEKQEQPWKLGGCLLGPYFSPPKPPFDKLSEDEKPDEHTIKELINSYSNHPVFANMTLEQKETLIRQILEGFYADPDEMVLRARHGLSYYETHGAGFFDQLYLISKPSPNKLQSWSNGGATQKNPLNSAEIVAALAALDFFSNSKPSDHETYTIATASRMLDTEKMVLSDLPTYEINQTETVDPERVVMATLLLNHLILHHIPWDKMHGGEGTIDFCKRYNGKDESVLNNDFAYFRKALEIIGNSLEMLLRSHTVNSPTGWNPEVLFEIQKYLSSAQSDIDDVKGRLEKKSFMRFWAEDKGPNRLGRTAAKFNSFEFGKWCPVGDFTNGEYLRFVWEKIYLKCNDQIS